jgi:hypothetical protein
MTLYLILSFILLKVMPPQHTLHLATFHEITILKNRNIVDIISSATALSLTNQVGGI